MVYKRKVIYTYDKKIWFLALSLALLPASWWFITSYLANAGDILGVFTNAKSIMQFGNPELPSLARDWSQLSLMDFLHGTLISLYASWGWMSLSLESYEYILVTIVSVGIIVLVYKKIDKKIFIFFCMLLLTNFSFMLLYSVAYDYQAQGRYLFPSIYIILGMLSTILFNTKVFSKILLTLFILLSVQNVYFSTKLTLFSYVDVFLEKPILWENPPQLKYNKNAKFNIDGFQVTDGKLSIRGWAYNSAINNTFDTMYLVLKNNTTYYRIALQKESRPDVAHAFSNKQLDSSGFTAKLIDLQILPKGTYTYLFAVSLDKKVTFIDIGHNLKI